MAIEWAFLKERGGENFELLLATLMRREYPGIRQLTPAQGDGGIDLILEGPDGNRIWQVKGFTTPISPGQKSQIRKSWKTFNSDHVDTGMNVVAYTLVTPWTPTADKHAWFTDLVKAAPFATSWDSAPLLNGLAAAHPDVIALFEKGPAAFNDQVMAKAVLAASAPDSAPDTMGEALAAREKALRDIRDGIHPNYLINVSVRSSSRSGSLPMPGPNEAGLMHRYENLGGDRWRIESVVAKHGDATDVEPITGRFVFAPEPGTPQEQQLLEFQAWGVPLKEFAAQVETTGGPFEEPLHDAIITVGTPINDREHPDLTLTVIHADGDRGLGVRLRVNEVTTGIVGRGARIVGASFHKTTAIEIRVGSELAPDAFLFTFSPTPGARPADVARELAWIHDLEEGSSIVIELEGELVIGKLGDVKAPRAADVSLHIAEALIELEPHAVGPFFMPDIAEVTDEDVRDLLWLAKIYGGDADTKEWVSVEIVVDQTDVLSHLDGSGVLAMTHAPEFTLGSTTYAMKRELAYQFMTPRLAEGDAADSVRPGDTVKLIPGMDRRHVIAAVVD